MASKSVVHRDVWGHEREGYSQDQHRVAYAPATPVSGLSRLGWLHWEERVSSLTAGAGVIWGAHVAFTHLAILDALWEKPGPLELCGVATLMWLHAKWLRSTRLH